MRLSTLLERQNNNFGLVRLLAALAVMVGHVPHGNFAPIYKFTGLEYSGSIGVYAFFLLSGMLVTASYNAHNSASKYIALRASRLWPALVVNVLICALILGPLLTSMPVSEYFAHPWTWDFITKNIALLGGLWPSLPHVFDSSHAKNAINYPLWTLPVEVQCYVAVLVIGIAGLTRRRECLLAASAVLLGLFFLGTRYPISLAAFANTFSKQGGYSFYPAAVFLIGIGLYAMRSLVSVDWRILVVAVIAYFALRASVLSVPFFYVAVLYGVLVLSSAKSLFRLRSRNDYSYGIYIYGFVCQQITTAVFPDLTGYTSLIAAIPMTLAFAMASWHFIEQPALLFTRNVVSGRLSARRSVTAD